MIEPRVALEEIRAQLREEVLPKLEDERARAIVVAALGILGDLALQVRDDDAWETDSAAELSALCTRLRLPASGDRRTLLETLERYVRDAWSEGRMEHVEEVRHVLASDLARQLERMR